MKRLIKLGDQANIVREGDAGEKISNASNELLRHKS